MSSRWMAAVSGPSSRLLMDFQQMKSVIKHHNTAMVQRESAYSLPAAQKAVAFMRPRAWCPTEDTRRHPTKQSPSDS